MDFLRYSKAELISMFMGVIVWTSLSTFMVVAKNAIGVDSIPVFETLIFLAGIVGIKLAYSRKDWEFRTWALVDIAVETIFLVALMYMLYFSTMSSAGMTVYGIVIIVAVIRKIKSTASRDHQDVVLKHALYKGYLRRLRNKEDMLMYVGGAIGTGIALVFITALHVNLISFTKVMIVLNVIQNGYDYYIWNKHLNK